MRGPFFGRVPTAVLPTVSNPAPNMSDSDASDDEQQRVAAPQPSVLYSRYATIDVPVLFQIAASPAAPQSAAASAVAGPRHSEHKCCLFNTAELVYQKRWTGADGCDIVLQPFAKHSANSDAPVALFKSTLAEVCNPFSSTWQVFCNESHPLMQHSGILNTESLAGSIR